MEHLLTFYFPYFWFKVADKMCMLSVLDPYRVKSKEIWGYNCAQHKETKMEAFSISLFGVLLVDELNLENFYHTPRSLVCRQTQFGVIYYFE